LSAYKIINKEKIPELQIIIFFNKPQEVAGLYKEHSQIETMFRAIKSGGL